MVMFCRQCLYPLQHLTSRACPECGQAFDPQRPETYLTDAQRPRQRGLALMSAGAIGAYALVILIHVVGTPLGDPLGFAFDVTMLVLAIPLKIAALVGVLLILIDTSRLVAGNAKATVTVGLCWSAIGLGWVALMALFRDPMANLLSNAAVKYLVTYDPDQYGRGAEFIRRWTNGEIVLVEASLVLVLAWSQIGVGYWLGREVGVRVVLPFVVPVLLVVHAAMFDLFQLDWDNFHSDIFSGGLLMDIMVPFFPTDPYSSIGTLCYTGVAAGWYVLDRRTHRDKLHLPPGENVPIAASLEVCHDQCACLGRTNTN